MPKLYLLWKVGSIAHSVAELLAPFEFAPTLYWSMGDSIGTSALRHKDHGFRVEEQFQGFIHIEDHLQPFVQKYATAITKVLRQYPEATACLTVAIYSERAEGLFLGNALLREIQQTGSGFDLDPYLIGD